jgi:glutaredoxin 3
MFSFCLLLLIGILQVSAFVLPTPVSRRTVTLPSSISSKHDGSSNATPSTSTTLREMKRPILDQIASTLFNLEMDRVESSSVPDEKGRTGEPMEWAEDDSLANKFSVLVSGNDLGYAFKQWVADIVAGDYDKEQVETLVNGFVAPTSSSSPSPKVKMFSFTTCPFCRKAKDYLEQEGIAYEAMELDELEGNRGNEIRATLGKITKRTSVPSIFINGKAIGGLNDGLPGLMPLAKSGELKEMIQ